MPPTPTCTRSGRSWVNSAADRAARLLPPCPTLRQGGLTLDVRAYMNKHPLLAAGVTGVAILFGMIMIVWQMRGGTLGPSRGTLPQRYFTIDDGKTYFPDSMDKIPPFTTADNKT